MKILNSSIFLWIFIIFVLLIFYSTKLLNIGIRNIFSIQLMGDIYVSPEKLPLLASQVQDIHYPECYSNWISGLIASKLGQVEDYRMHWSFFLQCSPSTLDMVQSAKENDSNLAYLAVALYPKNVSALFWLAGAVAKQDPKTSIEMYSRIIKLQPYNSQAWYRLGEIFDNIGDSHSAINAFLNCCHFGDYNLFGCNAAGYMMEKLGDPIKAIEYYRLSKSESVLAHAAELEKHLNKH